MKKEKLIGTTTIAYDENCSIQVLNIKETLNTKHKKEEHYYSDFYNVTLDGVYFIDRVELDPFCENLGYQLINNKLIIYNYDIVTGRKYHAVKKVFKYYDVIDNITINENVSEIIKVLGFDLPSEEKNKLEFVGSRLKKMDEFISSLEREEDYTQITPIVNICKKEKQYTSRRKYSAQMISPISRREFADYYTELVTGSDSNIKINNHVINISDYKNDEKKKVKTLNKDTKHPII